MRRNDRKPVDISRANTAADQLVDELLRVIRIGWAGDWCHFRQFSHRYLTKKGDAIAMAIPAGDEDRRAAADAIRAGY